MYYYGNNSITIKYTIYVPKLYNSSKLNLEISIMLCAIMHVDQVNIHILEYLNLIVY